MGSDAALDFDTDMQEGRNYVSAVVEIKSKIATAYAYKRRTQLWIFVIAFVMAAFLNVSVINIGGTLWRRPMVVRASPQNDLSNQNAIKQPPAG